MSRRMAASGLARTRSELAFCAAETAPSKMDPGFRRDDERGAHARGAQACPHFFPTH
jgi:hypothetical protein